MPQIKVKGHEINAANVKNTHYRRAVQFQNQIFEILKKIGLIKDDIEIEVERFASKKAEASVSWYFDGHHLHLSHSKRNNYAENLNVVMKILELEVKQLLAGEKTPTEFIEAFMEKKDIKERRKKARETLGLDEYEKDLAVINAAYKKLARKHHPDMPSGDTAEFKKINDAHKILKRELE